MGDRVLRPSAAESVFCILVSTAGPRLNLSESQYQDHVKDLNSLRLNFETASKTKDFVDSRSETESLAIL